MNVERGQIDLILSAIHRQFSGDVEIYFFGSRVDGTFHKGSDLDVLLKGKQVLDLGKMALVKEVLEDSDLPFNVDLLDHHKCSPEMRESVFRTAVRVYP